MLIFGWRHQPPFFSKHFSLSSQFLMNKSPSLQCFSPHILSGMNIMEAKWVAKEFHVDLNSAEGPGWDVSQNSPWTASCVTDLCKRRNDEVISMTAREWTESENQQCDIHTSGTQPKKMMTLLTRDTHVYNVACICHNKRTISLIKVPIFSQNKVRLHDILAFSPSGGLRYGLSVWQETTRQGHACINAFNASECSLPVCGRSPFIQISPWHFTSTHSVSITHAAHV